MARTRLSAQRLAGIKKTNIGHIIIFCEGKTEKYELLISNYLFETWLLMHFEEIEEKMSKSEIYSRLKLHLRGDYAKGDKGKTREIIQNGDVEKAIDNAKKLEEQYTGAGKSIFTNIQEMNPYTSVYRMVEQFMAEISDQEHYR